MDNIILIGMPGAGKSTIGVILAKRLCMSFADTDLILQQRTGRMLQEIIDTEGIDSFLAREEEAVCSFAGKGFVIATGGSVVLSPKAMAHLKSIGKVIFLQVGFQSLSRRIKNMRTRGVVLRQGQTLRDLYQERRPLYESYADLAVDTTGFTLEELADKVFTLIKSKMA